MIVIKATWRIHVLFPAMLGPVINSRLLGGAVACVGLIGGTAHVAIVRHEVATEQDIEHGVSAGGDLQIDAVRHVGPGPVATGGEICEAQQHVQ